MMTAALAGLSRTLTAELPSAVSGRPVLIQGWVHRRRVLGAVTFLIVRDRSGLAQVVARAPEALQAVRRCGEESVVAVTGVATRNPAAPGGTEVTDPRITLLGEPAQPPPVDLWRPAIDAALPAILDHAAVSWRHPARRACWELAAASLHGFRAALDELGFTEIQTPKLVPTATESGASVFGVDYFGRRAYLAQSPPDEPDLAPAHERAVGRWAAETHGSEFIAVEGYPMSKRPFYTHPQPGDGRWSNSFDLLFRGQELVTGGQRLHRYQDYLAAIRARGEDPAVYADYLEAFAHGMPPHGGFAIGLERWTGRLTQAENIREVTLFPRDLHRLTP